MRLVWLATTFVLLTVGPAADAAPRGQTHVAQAQQLTDDQVRRAIIRDSMASYPGSCPCPYNRAKNGSRCGKRSAYSRPGGYAPLCYPHDISDEMVRSYRQRKGVR